MAREKKPTIVTAQAKALKALFTAANAFAAREGIRPVLHGVHVLVKKGNLIVESANGFVAQELTIKGIAEGPDCEAVYEPKSILGLRLKANEDVFIDLRENTLWTGVEHSQARIALRSIEGTFPDFANLGWERPGGPEVKPHVALAPSVIEPISKATKALNVATVRFYLDKVAAPVLCTYEARLDPFKIEGRALLMPMFVQW